MHAGPLHAPHGALQHRQRRKREYSKLRHLSVSLRLATEHNCRSVTLPNQYPDTRGTS